MTGEQIDIFQAAAKKAGLPVSSWIRSIAISAARNLGVNPGRDTDGSAAYELKLAKLKAKEEHAAGVAERRAKREERKRIAAIAGAAWADLDKCKAARDEAMAGPDAHAIMETERLWKMADERAVQAQAVKDAFEA